MKPERPLAIEMHEQADQLRALATLIHDLPIDPDARSRLANCLVRHAAILALRGLHAERLERELATAQRTARELHAQAAEEADIAEAHARATDPTRAERQHRYARIIAGILTPPPGGCHLSGGQP